jgi:diacylglycerol kinase (ATP)
LKRLFLATINSWNGLKFAVRSEQAVREELVALLLAIPLAFIVGTTAVRRLELVVVVLLLIAVELLNTAIEKLADRLTREIDPQIRDVKDMGSAAVLAALIIAGATWLFALAERLGLL